MNQPHLCRALRMLFWVVSEVPHWFTPCVQLFFKNSFCMSSFYVVVYCRPLFPGQFFIFHKTPLQKHSSSLCHHLVVEFVRWVILPGQSNLKVSMDLLQKPFHDLKSSLIFNWCANFGLYFCVSKSVFHSLSNCWCHSSLPISHSVLLLLLKSFL